MTRILIAVLVLLSGCALGQQKVELVIGNVTVYLGQPWNQVPTFVPV